jgi:competence protein ComEC
MGGSALLTGDIQREGESALVTAALAPVDIVVAPHHGSATSSTQEFVAATAPRLVLFAAGYKNRWAFPKQVVVARWSEAGAQTLSTADSGAIEVLVSGSGPQSPRRHRVDARRYWFSR